jgi:hypothetical protein
MTRQFFQVLGIIFLVVTLGAVSPAWSDWLQPPDLTSNGVAVRVSSPPMPADDFQATGSGPITGIDIYTSSNGAGPWLLNFTLAIWSNIPANPTNDQPYSKPGDLLWSKAFLPGSYQSSHIADLDPHGTFWDPMGAINSDVASVWQFHFSIDPAEAFSQTAGQIYWLSVSGWMDMACGWQSTDPEHHWMDYAVWATENYVSPDWQLLTYSQEFTGQNLDLAFGISSIPIPATLPLLGSGLLGLLAWRRFRER